MAAYTSFKDVLQAFQQGEISMAAAEELIAGMRIEMVGECARLDMGRSVRCGMPEVVLGEGKDPDQLVQIARRYVEVAGRCVVTRITPDLAARFQSLCDEHGLTCTHHKLAQMVVLSDGTGPARHAGIVGVITAGTADIGVAEEARVIAEEMGCTVRTAYDVGAAGIHRLFPALKELTGAHVFIVAAGREGTLPAVVAGLTDRPVIGVPVSTGYGYMGKGEAALASLLQSCAVLAVVNIDAGFTAGAFAAQIARMVADHE
ncbi:MAG TPA: nickel pincer cofactor biosynthesis protein LarB [Methanoculleus sp.]|nr:nickel pincer cofactor biosynthesis protein LarB [Methanoculleus sp.]